MAKKEIGPRTGRGFYDYKGVDTRTLFNQKYKGFIELLRLYQRSKYLSFAGGITRDAPPEIDATTTNRKEMP
jgi:hypothetical protein